VRQSLNDTEALKERMPGPIPALTTSMTGNMPAEASGYVTAAFADDTAAFLKISQR